MRSESARQGYPVVEDTVRRVIEPHVEKLADMIAHNGVAAGTAVWLSKAPVNLLTNDSLASYWNTGTPQCTGLPLLAGGRG